MSHFVMKIATASSQADSQEISLNSNKKGEEAMHRWKPGKSLTLPHTEAMPPATAGNGITLPDLLTKPQERGRIALLILLLTLTAAWIDMLSYLSLGPAFASFMPANLPFIRLA